MEANDDDDWCMNKLEQSIGNKRDEEEKIDVNQSEVTIVLVVFAFSFEWWK